jgi:Kef-type K+ transport system membrane component KefB
VLRAVLFLGITVGLGRLLSGSIVRFVARIGHPGLLLVVGLALCFILAFAAELVGLAGIIGAFAAGLLLDPYGEGVRAREEEPTLAELMHPLSALFVPLFFVLMGIGVNMINFATPTIVGLGAVLVFFAIIGKLACGLGVRRGSANRLAVGIGMIPRGEVGLIFAGIGVRLMVDGRPVLPEAIFSAIVLMVLLTTVVAPIGLRWAFSRPGRVIRTSSH